MNAVISHVTHDTLFLHGILVGREFFVADIKYHVKWAIYKYEGQLYVVNSEKADTLSGYAFIVKRITY